MKHMHYLKYLKLAVGRFKYASAYIHNNNNNNNNATTLSCYTTPCQPLTARTDDRYPIVYYLNF